MIRIKAVDGENIMDVCRLKTNQDDDIAAIKKYSLRNAISVAETKYHLEMHPNAIYNNNMLIGFFVYKRTEKSADTAIICRFMIDDKFQKNGIAEKAFEHVLRGLKIQGVKKVVFIIDNINENAKRLCLSYGFQFAGKNSEARYCYEAEL